MCRYRGRFHDRNRDKQLLLHSDKDVWDGTIGVAQVPTALKTSIAIVYLHSQSLSWVCPEARDGGLSLFGSNIDPYKRFTASILLQVRYKAHGCSGNIQGDTALPINGKYNSWSPLQNIPIANTQD